MTPQARTAVQKRILAWYNVHGRDLPWRKTRNPYRILVAEIMLQQTQVPRVIEKYKEFLCAFPNTTQLANVSPAAVIRSWKGLGYNRRALFLQKTAQAIRAQHGGRFPKELDTLKELPGIGDYTARAILSFAFEQPVPMMDTNHRTFYSHLFPKATTDRDLLERAEWLLAGLGGATVHDWNQALMDFVSAIKAGERDKTIQWFLQKYPAPTQPKKKNAKKTVPFKQTDRYVRGRIIDALREAGRTRTQLKKAVGVDDERFPKALRELEKEGLIVREKGRIVLPE